MLRLAARPPPCGRPADEWRAALADVLTTGRAAQPAAANFLRHAPDC